MAGVSHILSVAKEALLTHQLSVQVASNNVANVDTPGYTRQSLKIGANSATPVAAGMLGGGVRGEKILRNYDQFMVQRLVNQQSTQGNIEAQQQSMRLVEAVFNEAPGLALNDLMNKFWTGWQDLSDNPEILPTRQSVVQGAQLVIDQLHAVTSEMAQAKFDIGVNLDTAIEDVNSIVSQIASLNIQISGAESGGTQANDLRDRRDLILKELSGLVKISYFEDKTGGYSVMLADGHSLVSGGDSWRVDWENSELVWVNRDVNGKEVRKTLGGGTEMGGKIGGWLEIYGELTEGNPENYLGRLDAFANALIREVNQQHTQGVGLVLFGETTSGAEQAKNVARLTTTVDSSTATVSIPAGTMTINNREIGEILGGTAVNGLAMSKAANAVNAISAAETGVTAKLTTMVAGGSLNTTGFAVNDTISFNVNGVSISYLVQAGDLGAGNEATFAANLANEVTTDLATYNALPTTTNPVTIRTKAGDGSNGGAAASIIFYNENAGDESAITITNPIVATTGTATAADLGLGTIAGNTYRADASHNTGQITLFSSATINVSAGANDFTLGQLGMASVTGDLVKNDGKFSFKYENGPAGSLLTGYDYFDELNTENGSFDMWIYNKDGSLAISQPVKISLERAYSLDDVASIINKSVSAATGGSSWITASNTLNSLRLTPDASHQFAFANDTSNFLQVAGLNTFFSGSSASTISLNGAITKDLNKIAAAKISTSGQIFRGDNSNSLKINEIQHEEYVSFRGYSSTTSLDSFYNSLVGEIANKTRTINRNYDFNVLMTNQLSELRDSVSGVSLDEEMANLVKYQHAYSAAARLVTMSDEMLTTLLNAV